jgi:hypothetical protein
MKVLFWLCIVGAMYSYLLYPLILAVMPRRKQTAEKASPVAPRVSLIIACRNERLRLRHKIENALASNYPDLEIIVASDASDDGSDEIVLEFQSRNVRLVRSPVRRGKEYAQGLAIREAGGEIIVFSDAGTDFSADAISHLVEAFRDPLVGAVSSEDTFVSSDGRIAGEGLYVRYEMWLRALESRRSGLVGLSGSFFAIQKTVGEQWNAEIPSDFACALNSVRAGLVAVSTPVVRGIYRDIKDPSREFQRKVRTAVRGMAAVANLREVLDLTRYGRFSFQVWSHKIMRWMVPWFLLATFVTNLWLLPTGVVYKAIFALQLAGYGAVLLAHFAPALRRGPLRIAYYFVQANIALAVAGVLFVRGRRIVVWEPSVR